MDGWRDGHFLALEFDLLCTLCGGIEVGAMMDGWMNEKAKFDRVFLEAWKRDG